MSWGEKSKKRFFINFCFLVNFFRYTGLMVTRGFQYMGGLSQLPVVHISGREKFKKKPNVLTSFQKVSDILILPYPHFNVQFSNSNV